MSGTAQVEVALKEVTLTRDLEAAKQAYKTGDAGASIAAHDAKVQPLLENASEAHGGMGSEHIKSIVFGGLDGIITTFAIISASAGAGFSLEVILLMGFANLIADGISMGFGDFLSEQAELDHGKKERKREMWEVENYIEGEKKEMVDIYIGKGMSRDEATQIIDILARHKDIFVDTMMVDELGINPPDDSDQPWKNGLITFLSFLIFGSVPLWCYVVFFFIGDMARTTMFVLTCVATALTMFLLGVFKAKVTSQNMIKSGCMMTLNGSLAASAAFLVGYIFEQGFDIQMNACP